MSSEMLAEEMSALNEVDKVSTESLGRGTILPKFRQTKCLAKFRQEFFYLNFSKQSVCQNVG